VSYKLYYVKWIKIESFICKQWTDEPELFKIDPIHQMPGLNT
ncbi:IS481 family transposase, partial [Acinetobacter johnsonii]|nr:IS481 family transposase [Acinetobacter johnsonii]